MGGSVGDGRCSQADIDKFEEKKLPITPPSPTYRSVIFRGLVSSLGLSPEDADAYIDGRALAL